jgi:hypothetical protein
MVTVSNPTLGSVKLKRWRTEQALPAMTGRQIAKRAMAAMEGDEGRWIRITIPILMS